MSAGAMPDLAGEVVAQLEACVASSTKGLESIPRYRDNIGG